MAASGHREFALDPKNGMLANLDGIPLVAKVHEGQFEGETITVLTSDGTPLELPRQAGQTVTMTLQALNLEARAIVYNATLAEGEGYVPWLNESEVTDASHLITLDNIPVVEESIELFTRQDDISTGNKTLKLKLVSGTPAAVDEFKVNSYTTGELLLHTSIATSSQYYVNYLETEAAAGCKLTHNFDPDPSSHTLILGHGVVNVETGVSTGNGYSIKYGAVTVKTRPPIKGDVENIDDIVVEFTVVSAPVETFPSD